MVYLLRIYFLICGTSSLNTYLLIWYLIIITGTFGDMCTLKNNLKSGIIRSQRLRELDLVCLSNHAPWRRASSDPVSYSLWI